MIKIEEIMSKEAVSFLRNEDVNSELVTELRTFIKGRAVTIYEEIGLGAAIPVYSYANNSLWSGAPEKLELAGLYFTKDDVYISSDYTSSYLCSPYDNWHQLDDLSYFYNQIIYKVKEIVWKLIDQNFDSIAPADEYDEKKVLELYNNGTELVDGMELWFKNHIEAYKLNIKVSDNDLMLEATNHNVDYEAIAVEHIQSNDIYSMIAKYKREKIELRKMSEANGYDHVLEIKKIMNKAKEEGKKYVTASFDFGWTFAENIKINTIKSAYTWMQTGTAQDKFTEMYVQPASMGDFKEDDYEKYMPFITRITYGKTVLFDHEVKVEHELENKFYNILYRYANSGKEALKSQVLEMLDNLELDLSVKVGSYSALQIIFNFYTELDIIKAIVEKGKGLFDEEIKNLYEKHVSNSMGYLTRRSRNYSEIMEYFEEKVKEQKNS